MVDIYYDLNVTLVEFKIVSWGFIRSSSQWSSFLQGVIPSCVWVNIVAVLIVDLTNGPSMGPEAPPFWNLYHGHHLYSRCSIVQSRASQYEVHTPVASLSPGRLLGILIHEPHLPSHSLRVGPSNVCFNQLSWVIL